VQAEVTKQARQSCLLFKPIAKETQYCLYYLAVQTFTTTKYYRQPATYGAACRRADDC
jgi:hypothetical protein